MASFQCEYGLVKEARKSLVDTIKECSDWSEEEWKMHTLREKVTMMLGLGVEDGKVLRIASKAKAFLSMNWQCRSQAT